MAKTHLFIQFQGREISEDDVVRQIKQYWKQDGHKLSEIKSLALYVKPEEYSIYYSINDDEQKGRIDL